MHVPRVAWSRTTRRVLTLENVYAIKITDYDAITAAGIRPEPRWRRSLFDTYLKQIFEDQFFHADPHPGNLFVTPVPATAKRAGKLETDLRGLWHGRACARALAAMACATC